MLRDLSGLRFGRLQVVALAGKTPTGNYKWLCKCDCGNDTIVASGHLVKEKKATRSCGCLVPDTARQKCRLPKGEGGKRLAFFYAKKCAKARSIPFDISIEDYLPIVQQHCFYCGCLPFQKSFQHNTTERDWSLFVHQGLDRVDSSKGYTLENVVPCCKHCNTAKMQMSVEEFKAWLIRVYNHWASK